MHIRPHTHAQLLFHWPTVQRSPRGKDVCKVKYPSSHEHATKLKSPYTTALHNVTSVMCIYENRFLALTQLSLKLVHAANIDTVTSLHTTILRVRLNS